MDDSFTRMKLPVAVLGTMLFLSACLKKEEPVQLRPVQYLSTASCSLNFQNFQYIFEKDIQEDINCLEKNFDSYVRIVRRKNEKYIDYAELKEFIQHFYRETREVSDDIFESGFDILAFLWGNAEKKFPVERVGHMFSFSRFLNRNIVPVVLTFNKNSLQENENYLRQRARLYERLILLGQEFEKFIDLGKEEKSEISLNVEYLLQRIGEGHWSQDKIQFFSTFGGVLKRMLVGGNQREITFSELFTLLEKLPSVALFLKDFIHLNEQKELIEQGEYADLLFYQFFATFSHILHKDFNKDDVLLSSEELSLFINYLYPKLEYEQLEQHIFLLKKNVFGSKSEDWNYEDIINLLAWGKDIFGSIYFNKLTYQHYNTQKEYNIILEKKPPLLNEYSVFSEQDIMKYWENFKLIVTRYRYFKNSYVGKDFQSIEGGELKASVKPMIFMDIGNDEADKLDIVDRLLISDDPVDDAHILSPKNTLLQYFNSNKNRVVKTLNEISTIRLFVSRIVDVYKKDDVIGLEEAKTFLQEFSRLFEFLSIDIELSDSFIEGVLDQIDIFQFQSDGNGVADVEEITEYAISLFLARKLAAGIYIDLRQHCPVDYSEETEQYFFETNCYRKRFFTIFFEEQRYKNYFNGLLNDPVLLESRNKYWNYFLSLEHLSQEKDKKDGEAMMDKERLVRLMVIFFNLEGVFERFDPDNNGIIGIEEIRKSYKIFRSFIYKKVASSGRSLSEKTIRTVYMYIIEKGAMPKTLNFSWYYLRKKEEDITSSREKLAQSIHAIL